MALNRESLIQVLRSTTTDVPSGLTFGELAYSDLNGKLFVGDADGNSIWIGAEVTSGSITTDSPYLVPTQSAVLAYVNGVVGGGSVVNSVNGTGGNITVTGDGQSQIATVSGTTTTFSNRLATTSVTGVASFSSDNFAVASGQVTIKNGGVANDELAFSSVTVSAGTGLGGGGSVSLGGSVTLANTGVLSLNGLTGARTLTGDGGALSGVGNDTIAIRVASTSVTGAASFSSDNFAVGAGGEVTIKNGGVANDELAFSSITVAGGGGSSTIALGQTLTITGTADEIEVSNSSGTITIGLPDNVTITGNLTVNGTVVTANVDNFVVEDPMIVLGTGNSGDSLDLGFYAKYVSGTTKYTGLFRDAPGGKYRLFSGLEVEPNTTVNTAGAGYAVATLVANIDGGSF